jgi:pimeloyl-ACP methyl ester carboxylesterase
MFANSLSSSGELKRSRLFAEATSDPLSFGPYQRVMCVPSCCISQSKRVALGRLRSVSCVHYGAGDCRRRPESFKLSQRIPNAQLIVYPDSGHGSQLQYPELFVSHARIFLDT